MFNRVKRYRKKRIKKAVPITRRQSLKLIRALIDAGISYTTFFDFKDGPVDDKVICLMTDTFIVKDYFGEENSK